MRRAAGEDTGDRITVRLEPDTASRVLPTPPDLALATKELVRHLWLTQRGASPGNAGALPDLGDPVVGTSYSWPWRVEQLIAPYLLVDL